jgi:hypothetical protein
MLRSRNIVSTLAGDTVRASVAGGCLQGGVLSPLLWSLVTDNLIWELNKKGYYAVGYVPDIAILINGKFPHTVSEVLQTALGTVQQWCDRTKLSINPKEAVIPFTRKRNIKGLKQPILLNKIIQLSNEVKYLGITIDKGLTWKKQVDKVTDKANNALWTCRGTSGKTWGLKPKVVSWIFTAVVRPIVTYGATICGLELSSKQARRNSIGYKKWTAWELQEP